jgi:hypothetical protein
VLCVYSWEKKEEEREKKVIHSLTVQRKCKLDTMGKHYFERLKEDQRYIVFDNWRLNSQFRIELLRLCTFSKVTLEAAAIAADVDIGLLHKFMSGADGELEYRHMTSLVRVFGLEDILIVVTPQHLDRPGVGDDDLTAQDREHSRVDSEYYWDSYRKACVLLSEKEEDWKEISFDD